MTIGSPGSLSDVVGRLQAGWRGWSIELLPEIDSTNMEARRRYRDVSRPPLVALLASHQSAGRGRGDNKWVAPSDRSLLVTVVAPTAMIPAPLTLLPLRVGVAVLGGINSVVPTPGALKWPNDVIVANGKVGGILCETAGEAVLIGIGVNLLVPADEFPPRPEGAPPARNLLRPTAGAGERDEAIVAILGAVFREIETPRSHELILQLARQACTTLGSTVSFPRPEGGRGSGRAVDLDQSGALVVQQSDGGRVLVTSLG